MTTRNWIKITPATFRELLTGTGAGEGTNFIVPGTAILLDSGKELVIGDINEQGSNTLCEFCEDGALDGEKVVAYRSLV